MSAFKSVLNVNLCISFETHYSSETTNTNIANRWLRTLDSGYQCRKRYGIFPMFISSTSIV